MSDNRISGLRNRHLLSAAGLVATALLALSGCGTGASAGSSGSSPPGVAYTACMRSHGVPAFPDPDSSGDLPKADPQQLGVSPPQLRAAQRACRRRLPNTGGSLTAGSVRLCELAGDCPAALVQQALTQLRSFAVCMRSHGVPTWPDPTTDSQGRPYFDLSGHGFSRQQAHSPQMSAKANGCGHVMHPDIGVPEG